MLESGTPQPKVTILYICENADKTIEASIHSVFKQTYVNWDLLIVDCNSSDATLRLAQVLAANGPKQPVRVLPYPSNDRRKIQFTLREHINGAYLFVLAQGDILHPVCVEALVTTLQEDENAPFAYSAFIPFEGSVGSSQYFEDPSISPGPFVLEKFLSSHQMPRSMCYRRTNRFVQIDFNQKYWATDFCLQHYSVGQEPAYVGIPLVNQPKSELPRFSYYHMSRMIARNRQHYSENEVNWHAAISELWKDPATAFTLVVVGARALFKDKNIRQFADDLSERFRLAEQNYLYLAIDGEQRELIAGVPLLPLASEDRGELPEKLREIGNKLCVVVLNEPELGYYLKASGVALFSTLYFDKETLDNEQALRCFDSVISSRQSEQLGKAARVHDVLYDFGEEGRQAFVGKIVDYCQGQAAVNKSQALVKQGHLRLVKSSLSKESMELVEGLDLEVILLCHDHSIEEFARAARAWQYVEGYEGLAFQAVHYGESDHAADLFSGQDIPAVLVDPAKRHSRAVAANCGLANSKSDWLLFVDGHHLPAPYLLALLGQYTKHLRRMNCFHLKATRLLPVTLPEQWQAQSYFEWMHVGMCTWWHHCDGGLLIKRSQLEAINGFSEHYMLWPYELDDLLLRLSWLGQDSIELPRGSILSPWSISNMAGEVENKNVAYLTDAKLHPNPIARRGNSQNLCAEISPEFRRKQKEAILGEATNSSKQAKLLLETAEELFNQGHSYAAMECMQHAVFIDPDDKRNVIELAKIYYARGQHEAFKRCYDRLKFLEVEESELEGMRRDFLP